MWIEQNDKLVCEFEFIDFKEAFEFMTKVSEIAETQNHHPWWSNVYNKVRIELSTHEAGNKVTAKDEALAEAIDEIYNQL